MLSGKIVDEDSQALEYVNVLLYDELDSTFLKAQVSDVNGGFVFEITPTLKYTLRFSFVGFEDLRMKISEPGDLGEIILNASSVNLEAVELTAKRPMIVREADKLIVNVEGNVIAQGNNLLELLSKSPGVFVDFDDNISLNGQSGVRIQIDGKDTRLGGSDLASLLRSMPANNIEKIEIISNPSARYEASGNAGIINIVTRQSKFYGLNGNLEFGPGYGRHFRWQNSMRLNYRNDKLNLYGNYSYNTRDQYMEIVQEREYTSNESEDGYLEIQNDFKMPISAHNLRMGLDYDLSEKLKTSLVWTYNNRNDGSDTENEILNYSNSDVLLGSQNTDSEVRSSWLQNMLSFNLNATTGERSSLDIDIDAARYSNLSDETYNSIFADGDGTFQYADLLDGTVDGSLELAGLNLDYNLKLTPSVNLEAGIKSTFVRTDNALLYINTIGNNSSVNEDLTNHFIYDENINGAYGSISFGGDKLNANIGLRIEDSNIKGNQITTDSVFRNDYVNLFPSGSLNYNINENNVLGLSVSRRIDRPGYNQLNPFRFFVNTNTFRSGNPLLRPQYTWSGELSYTFKRRYYFSFNVSHTIDNLNNGIVRDGDKELVLITPLNIDRQTAYACMISAPINFGKKWTSHWNLHASYQSFDGPVNGFDFDRSTLIVWLNANNNIELGKGYRFQFGGFIMPPHYISITRVETIASFNLGFQKSVLDGRGRIRFNVNDLFYTYYPRGRTNFGGLDDAWISYRDNQVANVSFSLDFGKMTVRPPKRKSSAVQTELNRIGQMNSNG